MPLITDHNCQCGPRATDLDLDRYGHASEREQHVTRRVAKVGRVVELGREGVLEAKHSEECRLGADLRGDE